MFRRAFTLPFKLFNIPVRLDLSFLFILPLFAFLIGSRVEPGRFITVTTPYILGLIAALGLFTSVLIHEIGHALTARRYGVETKEITLWLLGGVAQLTDLPKQRGAEAVVAIAGPLTSAALALIFFALRWLTGWSDAVFFVVNYLALTNVALAVFNLLPALPLDGGRVLRSLLALRFSYLRATKFAANTSQIIAVLLGVFGLLNGQFLLVAVAFFVYNAVQAETRYAVVTNALEGKTAADLMTSEVTTAQPDMSLETFRRLAYFQKRSCYPVIGESGELLGFAKLHDAENEVGTVADIITPSETLFLNESALTAFKRLGESQTGRIAVLDEAGRLAGIIGKTDIMRLLQTET